MESLQKRVRISLIFTILSTLLMQNGFAQNFVSTYAGSVSGFVDGDTSVAKFAGPFGICIDASDNLYIADADNNCIRKITSSGIVSTFAGTGIAGYTDGDANSAQFRAPSDLCIDAAGNIYVSDFENQRIRKIDISGNVSTIAGNGNIGYVDGFCQDAEFDYPRGIVIDSEGNLFISDSWNHRIRKINLTDSTVSTFAGGGTNMGVSSIGDLIDDSDTSARFYTPSGLAIDADDNIYVADAYNHRIRKITPDAEVSTIAGSGPIGPGVGGYSNGNALTSFLNTPTEIFVANDGRLFIGDTYNYRVRLLEDEILFNVAGNGESGYEDGVDSLAEFKFTRGVVLDAAGEHLYVCDYTNRKIRKITFNYFTGLENVISDNYIQIFPNPNNGGFQINNSEKSRNSMVNIFDVKGEMIYEKVFINSEIIYIDISDSQPGIYFGKICYEDVVQRFSVVISDDQN
ncbi:MAG: T9SS type A sorting domain-containing protein [Chitinophagales bacterium]|nr:T9SS type A sorting domain-containing protein [Chitinophagales bacterium]